MNYILCDIVRSWAVRRIAGNPIFGSPSLIYADVINIHLGGKNQMFEIWELETICNRQIKNDVLGERGKSSKMYEEGTHHGFLRNQSLSDLRCGIWPSSSGGGSPGFCIVAIPCDIAIVSVFGVRPKLVTKS